MSKQPKSAGLSGEHRMALEAICRRRKVDALVWKRARAFLLLDAGYDAKLVCEILDIGPTVLVEWKLAFAAQGLSFFGLKDYSQRQGHLSCAQKAELCQNFTDTPPRTIDEVRSHIAHQYEKAYSRSGACKLMCRLGFAYKKPVSAGPPAIGMIVSMLLRLDGLTHATIDPVSPPKMGLSMSPVRHG